MSEKKIKTLVIGLGNIGFKYDINLNSKNYYTTHAKSILHTTDFKLLGGVDKNRNLRKAFKKVYKRPAYGDFNLAIKIEKPDLVVVATNEKNHLDIVKKISFFKFVNYIVLEKPAGKNYQDLKKIISICKKSNIKLLINYFRLYNKYFKKIISDLRNKKIFASYEYNRGLRNNCSHLISFLFSINVPKKINEIKTNFLLNSKNKIISIEWGKIHCLLINPGVKKLSHTKLEIISKKKHFSSNNDFSEFKIANLEKSKFIKNYNEFTNYWTYLNKNKTNYQRLLYENFKKNIKDTNKLNQIFLMTSKLLDKLENFQKNGSQKI